MAAATGSMAGRRVRFWWTVADGDGVTTDYVFLLRDANGEVEVAHDRHHTGLFGRAVWLRLLEDAGFEPREVIEETTDDRTPRIFFVARRPSP